ncbi:MAG: hypothetical protein LIO42_06060 [Oscillospiraceae bacterium]|nr:hypothetical protein [Oscillospiraceae bacterium]
MKQPWRRLCLAAALVLAYLLLLVGGALLVCIYPARRQSDYVVEQAAAIAQADPAEREERISLATGANIYILLYDASSDLVRYESPVTDLYNNEPTLNLKQYLSPVLNGKSVLRLVLTNQIGRNLPDIMLAAGAPIVEGGTVTGAVFVIKNMMDVPYSVLAYSI